MEFWIEKYRPKRIDDVVGLPEGIKELLTPDKLPHLMFVGAVGTGKTSTARAISNELDANLLELNASDERGIDVIRNKVATFAKHKSIKSVKIALLDEADYLTEEGQASLRRIIETHASNCRFILTGNYKERIREYLRSRCQQYNFNHPPEDEVFNKLTEILEYESVEFEEEAVLKLIREKYPDIRRMINRMQQLSLNGGVLSERVIEREKNIVRQVYDLIKNSDSAKARKLWSKHDMDERVLLRELYNLVLRDDTIKRPVKGEVIKRIAEADYRMAVGAIPEIQLFWVANELEGVL